MVLLVGYVARSADPPAVMPHTVLPLECGGNSKHQKEFGSSTEEL